MNTTPLHNSDLKALDEVWPLGRQLILPEKATVVVAGCYKGRYMDYLLTLYPQIARMVGFEPQVAMAKESEIRITKHRVFRDDKDNVLFERQIEIYPSGLLHEDRPSVWMNNWNTDGATLFKGGGTAGEARMDEIGKMFGAIQLFGIDLFVMNLEGAEHVLIPHMQKIGMLKRINSIAIQFHNDMMPDENDAVDALYENYGPPEYDDYPTWSYWRKSHICTRMTT